VRKVCIRSLYLFALLSLIVLVGCSSLSTQKKFYEPITVDLHEAEYDSAVHKIEVAREKKKYADKDRFIYFMDAGLANHYAANFEASNDLLSSAEKANEEMYTKSVSREVASLVLNDNVLDYPGEDYEVIYTNLFKALNYLSLRQFDEAFVEVRRADLKLELLNQKYEDEILKFKNAQKEDSLGIGKDFEVETIDFNNDAFARYMSMHLYAADGQYDNARISHEKLKEAFQTQSQIYNFELPDVQFDSDDNAVLSVVAMSGLSPVKEALNLRLRTDKDLDLVQVLYDGAEYDDEEYTHFYAPIGEDYYFKFAIPVITDRLSNISQIVLYADGNPVGNLELLEDIGNVADATFSTKKALIFIKSAIRAVTKGLASHELKEKADTGGLGGWLKKVAIDVGSDILENADLRCSRLLPGKIHVGDFLFEPGTYNLRIEFLDYNGSLIYGKDYPDYKIKKGALNFIYGFSLN
jgi:uncharacterized protein